MRLLAATDIAHALPMDRAIGAMAGAFVDITAGRSRVAERQGLSVDGGTGLLMGAAGDGLGIAAKVVSVMPGNSARGLPGTLGLLLLMDDVTGQPLALMDGTAFTARRTAAVTACATDLLARKDARRAILFGCGAQAQTQLLGLDIIRDLEVIEIQGGAPGQAEAFIAQHASRVETPLVAVRALEESLAAADIIVTATNSELPLFTTDQVSPGVHISGIGSFRAGMCENDPTLAVRASVFVESRLTAMAEAGELIEAVESGISEPANWAEVGEVISGQAPGREQAVQVTFFKSVGHAVFDLYAARLVHDMSSELGLGTEWEA
jgi:ornithine cyclodeaminase